MTRKYCYHVIDSIEKSVDLWTVPADIIIFIKLVVFRILVLRTSIRCYGDFSKFPSRDFAVDSLST